MQERTTLEREVALLLGRAPMSMARGRTRGPERELSEGAVGRLFAGFASLSSTRIPEDVEAALKSSKSFRKHVARVEAHYVAGEDVGDDTVEKGLVTTGALVGKRVLTIQRVLDGARFVPRQQDLSAVSDVIALPAPTSTDASEQAVHWLENVARMVVAASAWVVFHGSTPKKTIAERVAKHVARELVVNQMTNDVLREVEKKRPKKLAWRPFLTKQRLFEIQMFPASEPRLTVLEHYATLEAMLTAAADEGLVDDAAARAQRDSEADAADLPTDLLLPELGDLSSLPSFTSTYARQRYVRRLLHSRWKLHEVNHQGQILPLGADAVKERKRHAAAFFPKGVRYAT